jgi:tetratricopeptide (TPR) repeat protein
VSPDGRWIVFVQCRNGLLMRPDSRLFIVSSNGGTARLMRCNTSLMNSWHSFSPNGRWLVFSSKSRSPYTQMFLTHIDKDGNDSRPILIENATAANRAVNIPGFLNVPPDGLLKIDTPVTDFYSLADIAYDLAKKGRYEAAVDEWKKALELSPADDKAHSNLGLLLAGVGRFGEAVPHFEETLKINPEYPEGHSNLASVLGKQGKAKHAIAAFRKVQEIDAGYPDVHQNLGLLLADAGSCNEAIAQLELALQASPASAEVHNGLAVCLVRERPWNKPSRISGRPWRSTPTSPRRLSTWGTLSISSR